ncbi:MAG: sugar phosphate nucleotidyltransferase [Eubacteriales bacterium]
MNIVLLSGGSGKRLWPLSNDIRSKQFLKLFKNEAGEYESMVQRVYSQILEADADANVAIATGKAQLSTIKNQVGEEVAVCVEPARRDTFAAIVLATAFLHSEQGVGLDETVVICPVDPYVDGDYFQALKELYAFATDNDSNLSLMGVEPTSPSDKFGYIIPETEEKYSRVEAFKEKPSVEIARDYIAQGALWNCGVFAFRVGYLLEKAKELIGFTSYIDLYNTYENVEKISFDYAVVEKETQIDVMRFAGQWKDIGTWDTFSEELPEQIIGQGMLNDVCENTHIINELNIPILGMGLKDFVVAASGDGILISKKEQSGDIKSYVNQWQDQVMFAEKSWGRYEVMDMEPRSMTIKVTLNPGSKMNYHSHEHRDEVWTVISGKGSSVVDGMVEPISAGDVITMQAGCKHMVFADTELKIMEVQIGEEISVHDKKKYEWES